MNTPKLIQVIKRPHGEAPLEVRSGWIGCIMPCEPECGHVPAYVAGVLSGPSLEKIDGFSVPQDEALAALEKNDPEAARWFRQKGFPRPNECFRFKYKEVRVVACYTDEEERKLGPRHVATDMETGTMRFMG